MPLARGGRSISPYLPTPPRISPYLGPGTLLRGALCARAAVPSPAPGRLLVGPDARGHWAPATLRSIKYKELGVGRAVAGQSATVSLQVALAGTVGGGGRVRVPWG